MGELRLESRAIVDTDGDDERGAWMREFAGVSLDQVFADLLSSAAGDDPDESYDAWRRLVRLLQLREDLAFDPRELLASISGD